MVFKVKNTTILRDFSIFSVLCPENCRGCGDRGEILCGRCKKYIFRHYRNVAETYDKEIFKGVFSAGFRDEILGELVEEYKYYSARRFSRVLAEVFEKTILEKEFFCSEKLKDELPLVLVPLPTSRKHIRERGFDHILEIAKRIRGIEVSSLLSRAKDTTQVGASEKKRLMQAKEAYKINPRFSEERFKDLKKRKIILFDDVWTTGASLTEAGRILKKEGFENLYGATLVVNRRGRKPELRRGGFD